MYQSLIHLAFTILTVAVAVRSEEQAPPCVSGVYMIVARGTNQPQTGPPDYGEGKQYTVAQMVKKQVNDSNDVDLVYPAIRPPYAKSEGTGVKHMINMIHQYANNCPNDKIVLMGYSQVWFILHRSMHGILFQYLHKPRVLKSSLILFADPSMTAVPMIHHLSQIPLLITVSQVD